MLALKLLLTVAQNVTEYSELEFFQLHLWASSLGEPGVAPTPKIHKIRDLPSSHFPPLLCTTPCWTNSQRGRAWAGEGFQGKANSPLVAVQNVFLAASRRSHGSCPADGNSPAQGTASAGFMAALSCRAQPEPSSDLARPKHEFPELKIPIWGIYGAPRQPLQSTGSASPPAHLKLHISMPIPV